MGRELTSTRTCPEQVLAQQLQLPVCSRTVFMRITQSTDYICYALPKNSPFCPGSPQAAPMQFMKVIFDR